jgi:hypothetical protein
VALEAVRKTLVNDLPPSLVPAEETGEATPDCAYDAASLARGLNGRALSSMLRAPAERIGGEGADELE